MKHDAVVIIGGGPAGLTAAYELAKKDLHPLVLEKSDKVGGIARTEDYKGYRFDMGGHRFYTKSEAVKKMWAEVLGKDFLRRPRLSRIYYHRRFFNYPLKPINVLINLGLWESARIILSYVRWKLRPHGQENTFEEWVTNRFGKRLFLTFFKTYTEKVWGISCSELKAEWAAQRIKDLSLKTAVVAMFLKPQTTIKTLIDEFQYPRFGPGMMWNAVKERIEKHGGVVRLHANVVKITRTGHRIDSVVFSSNGHTETVRGAHFISSMPVTELITKLDPPPSDIVRVAQKLRYRDFLTVCLIVNKPDLFPDNWIYIHDPSVHVGRIQNFKNWSPEMVPDPAKSSLGLEYFCAEGDGLWNRPDHELIELAKREVDSMGLAAYADIEDGCVFRVPKAYPVYDSDYQEYLAKVRGFMDGLENVQTIGRNGLHRYNNQDHSMLTGMLAVRNLLFGERNDLWQVNAEQEYHEEMRDKTAVSSPDMAAVVENALGRIFHKVDRVALGLSIGTIAGLALLLVTLVLAAKGGDVVGPNLQLLGQFFPGYQVTGFGSLVGLSYGFAAGFAVGWSFAFLRNLAVFLSMVILHRRTELHHLRKLLEYV